ncbi:MAG: pectic acid lyase [Planctomycetales bacterium]|nr:pectic acid lyase [Planctomycetales bacterium]
MLLGLVASQLVPTSPLPAADPPTDLAARAKQTMRRAATYYRTQVATHGGYVYHYTPDLKTRWGEGLATVDQIWVQPPGTPTVGLAFLRAYEATGDEFYLDAATDAALALVYGQLESGGWTNSVDFNPRGDDVAQYRNGRGKGKNNSTLDDGITQGALRLLMHVDRAHEFRHAEIHEAARIALDALLAAQFPNGGFPQVWTGPVEPQPIVKANFPEYDWRTEGRIKEYWTMYTLNDGLAGTVATTLIDAAKIYRDKPCADAAKRLGDFLILAQLPEPQPAWAQQYNYAMQPIWARRFEPPAVTGGESQDAIETLMTIYRVTGDEKYLQPIPAALAYLRKSLLDDGRLARYYELQTNKPLYMNRNGRDYYLTHDDRNLPDHYGWKIVSRLDELAAAYERCRAGDRTTPELSQSALEQQVRTIIANLDDQDRWMSVYDGERLIGQPKFAVGDRYLSSQLFSDNLETLSRFLKP